MMNDIYANVKVLFKDGTEMSIKVLKTDRWATTSEHEMIIADNLSKNDIVGSLKAIINLDNINGIVIEWPILKGRWNTRPFNFFHFFFVDIFVIL